MDACSMGMDSPPQAELVEQNFVQQGGSVAQAVGIGFIEDPVELSVENDLSLAPTGPSALLVEPAATAIIANAHLDEIGAFDQEHSYESHSPATRRDRGYSKLSPLAWLFS